MNQDLINKWYGSARWTRRRKLQMTLHPLCELCAQRGEVVPAEVADHVTPHKGDEQAFFGGPLQSVCSACHDTIKRQQEHRGYHTAIGIDGNPIDPHHPWNN
jgi:hypothetical protein